MKIMTYANEKKIDIPRTRHCQQQDHRGKIEQRQHLTVIGVHQQKFTVEHHFRSWRILAPNFVCKMQKKMAAMFFVIITE